VDEDDELQVAEWDQAAADTAYREQVGRGRDCTVWLRPMKQALGIHSADNTKTHTRAA
jgi:hypothetical protein